LLAIPSRANATFAQVFRAKLPSGYQFNINENSQGTNSTSYWLTSQVGTGRWEEYIRVSHCGNTGTFDGGGHVSVSGPGGAFEWHMASATVFDITNLTANQEMVATDGTFTGNVTVQGGNVYIKENPLYGAGLRLHHNGTNSYVDFDGWLNIRGGGDAGDANTVIQVTPSGYVFFGGPLWTTNNLELHASTGKEIQFFTDANPSARAAFQSNGNLWMGAHRIVSVAGPVDDADAARWWDVKYRPLGCIAYMLKVNSAGGVERWTGDLTGVSVARTGGGTYYIYDSRIGATSVCVASAPGWLNAGVTMNSGSVRIEVITMNNGYQDNTWTAVVYI
jgi:hypothetical protein